MPIRVAILGGGMGSLSAAWKLANQGGYDITVYQRDWRLGGKCSSTRSSDPDFGKRIEEHGIHLLMGFYDNALKMLKECYDELDPAIDGILPWEQALTGWDEMTMGDPVGAGWGLWKMPFPTNTDPIGTPGTPTILMMCVNAFGWLVTFLGMIGASGASAPPIASLKQFFKLMFRAIAFLLSLGLPVGWLLGIVKWWLDKIVVRTWEMLGPVVDLNPMLRRLWIGIWFTATNLRGMIEDDILKPPHDFSVIDHMDYRAWLQARSVVSPPAHLAWDSPPIDGLYDLAFCYGRQLAAGTVLYNALHIGLGYKGHLAYKMNAGMGEVVFVPLYRALKAKGVKFKFLHEVTALRVQQNMATGERWVDRIEFNKQDPMLGNYEPLTDGVPITLRNGTPALVSAWPDLPTDMLNMMQPYTINKGGGGADDFDVAVLGIPVAALPAICADLGAMYPRFQQMMTGIDTLKTQSLQIWLNRTLAQMGWPHGSASLISGPRPFNSWVDMEHLGGSEDWPTPPPKTLAYFCDEFVDVMGFTTTQTVDDNVEQFVQNVLPNLWPGFTLADLHDPDGGAGIARLAAQYWRANTDPSDQYVIFTPGTNNNRLAADASGFHNLALAGDWVETALNSGCVEAAVTGGLGAADAIIKGRVHV